MSTKIRQPKAKFGELAIKAGIITLEQLNDALRVQIDTSPWKALGEMLIEMGACTRNEIEMILDVQSKLQNGGYDAEEACRANEREDSVVVDIRALAKAKGARET